MEYKISLWSDYRVIRILCLLDVVAFGVSWSIGARDYFITLLLAANFAALLLFVFLVVPMVPIFSGLRWAIKRNFHPPSLESVDCGLRASAILFLNQAGVALFFGSSTGFLLLAMWKPVACRSITLAMLIPLVASARHSSRRIKEILSVVFAFAAWMLTDLFFRERFAWLPPLLAAALLIAVAARLAKGGFTKLTSRSAATTFTAVMFTTSLLLTTGHAQKVGTETLAPDDFALARSIYGPASPSAGMYMKIASDSEHAVHQFYDIVPDPGSKRLYFTDKEPRHVGYIDLESLETTSRHVGWLEQMVVERSGEYELDSVYINLRSGVTRLDPDSLEVEKACLFLIVHDLQELPKGLRIVDMEAVPFAGFEGSIGAIIEYSRHFYLQDARTCKIEPVKMPTMLPYETLCSKSLGRCWVSGWLASSTLTEISIDERSGKPTVRGLLVGLWSLGMLLLPSDEKLLVVRPLAASIDIIDTTSFSRVSRIPAPPMARNIAYSPELGLLFVPEYFYGRVHLLDVDSGAEVGEFQIGPYVREIVWNSELGALFVADARRLYRFTIKDLEQVLLGRAG